MAEEDKINLPNDDIELDQNPSDNGGSSTGSKKPKVIHHDGSLNISNLSCEEEADYLLSEDIIDKLLSDIGSSPRSDATKGLFKKLE